MMMKFACPVSDMSQTISGQVNSKGARATRDTFEPGALLHFNHKSRTQLLRPLPTLLAMYLLGLMRSRTAKLPNSVYTDCKLPCGHHAATTKPASTADSAARLPCGRCDIACCNHQQDQVSQPRAQECQESGTLSDSTTIAARPPSMEKPNIGAH